jgi:hypothetical protein
MKMATGIFGKKDFDPQKKKDERGVTICVTLNQTGTGSDFQNWNHSNLLSRTRTKGSS